MLEGVCGVPRERAKGRVLRELRVHGAEGVSGGDKMHYVHKNMDAVKGRST